MYTYKIKIKKVSGRLNESVLPSRNLVIKSKVKKSDKRLFAEASSYYKKKYGLVIESADVTKMSHGTRNNEMTASALLEIMNNYTNDMIIDVCDSQGNLCSARGAEYRDGKVFIDPRTSHTLEKMTVDGLCGALKSIDPESLIMVPDKGGDYKIASEVKVIDIYKFGGGYDHELVIQ